MTRCLCLFLFLRVALNSATESQNADRLCSVDRCHSMDLGPVTSLGMGTVESIRGDAYILSYRMLRMFNW